MARTAQMVAEGQTMDYTPGSAVTAGDVVSQSNLLGVANSDIAANEKGALAISGIFEFPKASASVYAVGDKAYWDIADQEMNVDSANPAGGLVVEAAGSGVLVVKVLLNGFHK